LEDFSNCEHLHRNESRWLGDPCIVEARDLLEPALLPADPLVHLDTTAYQAGSEDELVVVTHKGHGADLGEARLDEPDGLERGGDAENCDGVAFTGVGRVEGEVAVRGVEQGGGGGRVKQFCCGHACVGWEVRGEDGYVGSQRRRQSLA
jgi:hypothetical protein